MTSFREQGLCRNLYENAQIDSGAQTPFRSTGTGEPFRTVNWPGGQADHSPLSSTEVKMSYAILLLTLYTSLTWTGATSPFYFLPDNLTSLCNRDPFPVHISYNFPSFSFTVTNTFQSHSDPGQPVNSLITVNKWLHHFIRAYRDYVPLKTYWLLHVPSGLTPTQRTWFSRQTVTFPTQQTQNGLSNVDTVFSVRYELDFYIQCGLISYFSGLILSFAKFLS